MIKAIAFDLDDTLLDTTGLLAPRASLQTFEFMVQKGLKLTLAECEAKRQEWVKSMSHREVFERLAYQYGTSETVQNLSEINAHFYEARLPEKLPLIEGARENLDVLKKKYDLFLVTAGAENAQMSKIHALGILSDFKRAFVVNTMEKKRKKDVFLSIIQELDLHQSELLCVGNSIQSEIKDAMSIGAVACYFEFGEERGSLRDLPKAPDYHIRHHKDLIPTCQL